MFRNISYCFQPYILLLLNLSKVSKKLIKINIKKDKIREKR